jgi:hypothetical protein
MHDTQELENKTLQILKAGYMPADNKNLVTFVTIATLYAVTTAAAFALGFQLSTKTAQNNLTSLQEYRHLEAEIINAYEDQHGIVSTLVADQIPTPYRYIDQSGNVKQITTPPPRALYKVK